MPDSENDDRRTTTDRQKEKDGKKRTGQREEKDNKTMAKNPPRGKAGRSQCRTAKTTTGEQQRTGKRKKTERNEPDNGKRKTIRRWRKIRRGEKPAGPNAGQRKRRQANNNRQAKGKRRGKKQTGRQERQPRRQWTKASFAFVIHLSPLSRKQRFFSLSAFD